jgi:hypothetical protein
LQQAVADCHFYYPIKTQQFMGGSMVYTTNYLKGRRRVVAMAEFVILTGSHVSQ